MLLSTKICQLQGYIPRAVGFAAFVTILLSRATADALTAATIVLRALLASTSTYRLPHDHLPRLGSLLSNREVGASQLCPSHIHFAVTVLYFHKQ